MLKSILARTLAGTLAAALVATPTLAETIVLKLNSPAPPWSYINKDVLAPWAAAVEADSQGTLRIQAFYGGTLGNFANTYDRVVDRVVDIGFILTAFAAGKIKQQDVAALPFEAENSVIASQALWNLYEKGVSTKDWDAVKPLGLWTFPNSAFHSREPIRTLDDFKGKKLIASNAIAAKIVAALGATPISFRPDEAYTALQRGTTEGVLMPFTGMATFKINEVTKFHLDAALGSDPAVLMINRKVYDALPAPAKAAIDKHSGLVLSRKFGQTTNDEWLKSRNLVKDTTVTLSPTEEKAWKERLAPIAADWVKRVPDGDKVLAAFRAEVAAARSGK